MTRNAITIASTTYSAGDPSPFLEGGFGGNEDKGDLLERVSSAIHRDPARSYV